MKNLIAILVSLSAVVSQAAAPLVSCKTLAGAGAAHHVLVGREGKVYASGTSYDGDQWLFTLIRYTANGEENGMLRIPVGKQAPGAAFVGAEQLTDGRLVVAGYVSDGMGAATTSSIWLTTVSRDLKAEKTTKVPMGDYASADTLLVQPDGKFVVAGSVDDGVFAVRFLANGELDKAFGKDGVAKYGLGANPMNALLKRGKRAAQLMPDGKIAVAGNYQQSSSEPMELAVARFDENGRPSGMVHVGLPSGDILATSLAVSKEGVFSVSGMSNTDGFVLATFAEKVRVSTKKVGETPAGIFAMSKGFAVGEAFEPNRITIARVNERGEYGETLWTVPMPKSNFTGAGENLTIAPDGKIIVAGQMKDGCNALFFLARLLPNGELDKTFGFEGRIVQTF